VKRGTGRRARSVARSRLHAVHALPPHMGMRASVRRLRFHHISATWPPSSSTTPLISVCTQSAVCSSQRSAATHPASREHPHELVRKDGRRQGEHRSRMQRYRGARAVARASHILGRMRRARERARARKLADVWQAGRAGTGRWRRRTRGGPFHITSRDRRHILELYSSDCRRR
jgi:hypothetical protein